MKTLSESLLSDFDTLEKNSESEMYLQEIYKKFEHQSPKKGCDVLGRKLKVGDLVIINYVGLPLPGLILDINQNKDCAVSIRGDVEFIKMSYGPRAGQISSGSYCRSSELLKIDEQILKMLYNIK